MLTIDNITTKLFENFPSFKQKTNYEADELIPYNIIGDFTFNFQEDFIASKLSDSDVDKFFEFINEMANSQDIKIQNILVVEVLAMFSDRQETINLAREKLNSDGREMLEKTLKGWK